MPVEGAAAEPVKKGQAIISVRVAKQANPKIAPSIRRMGERRHIPLIISATIRIVATIANGTASVTSVMPN